MITDLAEKQGEALKLSTYTQGGFTDLAKAPMWPAPTKYRQKA
jgi:hypothetical protein